MEQVRTARIAGARITVDFARQADAALVETARELLTAALADSGPGDEITLQVHPPGEGHPALLLLHVRSMRPGHDALCRSADEFGRRSATSTTMNSRCGSHQRPNRLPYPTNQPDSPVPA
jgi:hypothetical protein